MCYIDCINQLNGVDGFDYEIGYKTECNGDVGCNATKFSLYYQGDHL